MYGELIGYRLFFDQESRPEYVEIDLPASVTSYRAKFLFKDTVYRFQGVCDIALPKQTTIYLLPISWNPMIGGFPPSFPHAFPPHITNFGLLSSAGLQQGR